MRGSETLKPLIAVAAEALPESFEARVLRELAALGDRVRELEAAREPRIVAWRHATLYDPLAANSFTFTGVKDENGAPVDFTIDAQGAVRVDRREVAPGIRETYLPSRMHEADLPGVDFSTDDTIRCYTHTVIPVSGEGPTTLKLNMRGVEYAGTPLNFSDVFGSKGS